MQEFACQQYRNESWPRLIRLHPMIKLESCCLNGLNIVNAIYQASKGVILKQVGSIKIGGFDDVFICHIRVAGFSKSMFQILHFWSEVTLETS